MAEILCAVYMIVNTATGDFYIGSSKDVKSRWTDHKKPSVWKKHPNNPMYLDMKKYGTDKFAFEILEEAEPEELKVTEQKFIETLKPTYNSNRANGWDFDRYKEYQKEFYKEYNNQLCCYNGEVLTLCALSKRFSKAGIEHPQIEAKKYLLNESKEYQKEHYKSDKFKEYQKTDKYKEYQKEFYKEYNNQLCSYNGEKLTLCALSKRFQRASIPHPQLEAKKYLLQR